ncbi:MAG: alpha-L-fucosidase [Promethearchaeota archaeon]
MFTYFDDSIPLCLIIPTHKLDYMFKPTKRSIKTHKVPDWFHNAKLGIFIHWGLYSVPAFAEITKSFGEIMETETLGSQFAHNPYSEWYLNSLRIEGTKTYEYHQKEYGPDFKYEDFAPIFNEEIKKWNPEEMANIFQQAGAKYVVLVTKHHDGFTMWKSDCPNPNPGKQNYHASRDIVGELTNAVDNLGMKMALYYSGKIDWSFDEYFIKDIPTMLDNEPRQPEYPDYSQNHWYELIRKYKPWILWNDIGYPKNADKLKLFADYFNENPEGLINDLWIQMPAWVRRLIRRPRISKFITKIANLYVEKRRKSGKSVESPYNPLYDFSTPEYQTESEIKDYKWETCRGLGNSFGYNKQEKEENYLSPKELIHQLIDVVSKNGNLLINIGPKADGTIPVIQKKLILDLGAWLKINGEAIYGTRSWKIPEAISKEGIPIRFTTKEYEMFMILLDKPELPTLIIQDIKFPDISEINLIGNKQEVKWGIVEDTLVLELPRDIIESHAYAFKITLNK